MCSDDLPEPAVEQLSMFVKDHSVRIPVQLLETQTRIVLVLNLLNNNENINYNLTVGDRSRRTQYFFVIFFRHIKVSPQ